jgi:hypothetical protein
VVRRKWLDQRLDAVRFKLDCFPTIEYHPLPWVGKYGERTEGTLSRWEVIKALTDEAEIRSALDIGANAGFFSISLALTGVDVIAIERDARAQRILAYTKSKLGLDNLAQLDLNIRRSTVHLLPRADLVLCLSVWHHWVREHGFAEARELLADVWDRCNALMLFDTGQQEMPSDYRLPPMEPSPQQWLKAFLNTCCSDGKVEYLGEHAAFDPEGRRCMRSLFAIRRA